MAVNHTPKRSLHEGAKVQANAAKEIGLPGDPPPPRIAESAALDIARTLHGDRVVCTSIGRGQAARGIWRDRPTARISLCYLDQFQQQLAIEDHRAEQSESGTSDDRLSILCVGDLPAAEFDLAIVPCSVRGEAELQREWLQQAYLRLEHGGRLVSSVDNPKDRWLHEQMQEFGTKVSVVRRDDAAVYVLAKDKPLRRERSFECEFCFRDRDQTIVAVSRPGVFSHRHLDGGSKALLDAAEVQAGDRIIDVGCGSGVVGLALAKRAEAVHVLAIDSNIRAVQCTALGAVRNGLSDVTTLLTSEGQCDQPASYDIALCNPPYYSHFRIAQRFIDAARRALRPGGRIYVVTKKPEWYHANMYPGWRDTTVTQSKQYAIVAALRG